jgi:hypothetical protein
MRRTGTLIVAALMLSGCARLSGAGSAPATVRAGLKDSGTTLTLRPGDRLEVDLGRLGPSSLVRWTLRGFPAGVLGLASRDGEGGRFVFVARGRGEGKVVVVGGLACSGGPLPQGGVQCPMTGSGANEDFGQAPVPIAIPLRLFTLTVRVR